MNVRQKATRAGIVFITLLLLGGLILMYKGNDALVLATEKKEGILTAEQIKMSFNSVSGRLIKEHVKDGDFVKKGDIIMELDATDTDLSIKKLKAQIAQLDAQIRSASGTQGISYQKADNDAAQSSRQLSQQQVAVSAANATLKNARIDYNRKVDLLNAGAIAQSQLDDAEMTLNVAESNLDQQNQLLQKLQTAYNGSASDTIGQARQAAANMSNDIDSLTNQRQALEIHLNELQVTKERLTLRAPEDGKVLKVLAKEGEMISPSTPVVLLESSRSYFDIYISEEQAVNLSEGQVIAGHTVAGDHKVTGTIRLLTQAPGFADLKQTREKGQSDLSAFQVRICVDPQDGIIPGMTIGVKDSEFLKR